MHHLGPADYAVIGAFAVAFFGLLAWVIGYAVSTAGDWRRTATGRHLMSFRAALVIFMAMGVANNVWPHYPGRDIVRVTVVSFFAITVLDACRILWLAQHERRHVSETVLLLQRRDDLVSQEDGTPE